MSERIISHSRTDGKLFAGIDRLINRHDNMFFNVLRSPKKICIKCRFVSKNVNCPHCRKKMVVMDYWGRARSPRKGASKSKWDKFYRQFNVKEVL